MSAPIRRARALLGQLSPELAGHRSPPVKVLVTGAAGNIAYSALFLIGRGAMLGPDQQIELRLLDVPGMEKQLAGVEMELIDCAFPLVTKIVTTTEYEVAFKDVDIALLIGAKPRGPGMQRADLMRDNAKIFVGQGQALDRWASRNVKVLVVGNPCNTNCLIAMSNAPSLSPSCFGAMTRLDELRTRGNLAQRLGVTAEQIKNVIVWGNHSKTQYPDVNSAHVADFPAPGKNTPIRAAVKDDKYLNEAMLKRVQDRGAEIIAARQKSSAASAAVAALDTINTWVNGTAPGEVGSMGIVSDGSYGIPKGLVYSFPLTFSNGGFKIVHDISIDAFSRKLMDATAAELLEEKKEAGL